METLEHLYAHAIDEHELIHASNPYGCNQYGHEWRAKHGQNTGNSTKDDIDREIDDYMKLSPEKKKHQLTNWRNEAARAEKEWKNFTKTQYNPAYVKVHGRDDKPTEADRRDLEQKTRQRDQLEQKANELLQKNRERIKRVAQSQGRTPQEIEEHLNKYYPKKVK